MKRFDNLKEDKENIADTSVRFRTIGGEELEATIRGRIPANTSKSTKWTVRVWNTWVEHRNGIQQNSEVPKVPMLEGNFKLGTMDISKSTINIKS